MGLYEADDNLLEDIFAYCSLDALAPTQNGTWCSLSLVGRRFRSVAQRLLFRDVKLIMGYRPSQDTVRLVDQHGIPVEGEDLPAYVASKENRRRWELFERTLEESPDLALFTRTADLCWPAYDPFNARVNEMLLGFRNVQSLSLKLTFTDSPEIDRFSNIFRTANFPLGRNGYRPVFGDRPALLNLRTIRLGKGFNLRDMVYFMKLPQLQTCGITAIAGRQEFTPPDDLMRLDSGARDIDIHATRKFHISFEDFQSVLDMTPRLRVLRSPLPEQEELIDLLTNPSVRGPGILCPGNISSCLHIVKQTLQELRLVGGRKIWSLHDGSRLNLSDFSSLRVVDVPAACFFPARGPQPDDTRIDACLPPSVEVLELTFDERSGLFYKLAGSNNTIDPRRNDQLEPWKLDWLMLLAHRKRRGDSNLRKIDILERLDQRSPTGVWTFHWEAVSWTPPQDLEELFEEAGIELRVRLRVPVGFHHRFGLEWDEGAHIRMLLNRHGGGYSEIGLPY